MSRIGIQPIKIEDGVQVEVADKVVKVKGPKGDLNLKVPRRIEVEIKDGDIIVTRKGELKQDKSNHGTVRAILASMIKGVTEGYKKELELVGMGYRAELQGRDLVMYLGWNHPIKVTSPEDITFTVKDQVFVEVSGADKQKVGLWTSNIRKIRKPEPYKGKGIKYVEEVIRRKTSKSVKEEAGA